MVSRAFDDLNQFFDFDQLEHDHGAPASTDFYQGQAAPCSLEDVMAIDWAAGDDPAPQPDLDAFQPVDIHMQDFLQDVHSQDHAHWPLADVPQHSANNDLPSSFLEPEPQQLNHAQIVAGDAFNLPIQSSYPGLSLANSETSPSTHSEEVVAASRSRPTPPTRQASTASWKPASAKRKGPQSRIPLEARQILEDEFIANPYPCSWEMDIIAHQANLDVKKVRNWFNNTRARKKGEGEDIVPQVSTAER